MVKVMMGWLTRGGRMADDRIIPSSLLRVYEVAYLRFACLGLLLLGVAGISGRSYKPQSGDIVFQTSMSAQSQAIQLATHSRYSHMGVVFVREGDAFVLEAVQPVKVTPFEVWLTRGAGDHLVVKRLKDTRQITATSLEVMHDLGLSLLGKDYDLTFEWSDYRIYCSELVWKLFDQALGIELCELQTLADFDLSHPLVEAKIKERYGANPPLHEPVVSPAAVFDSPLLVTVFSN